MLNGLRSARVGATVVHTGLDWLSLVADAGEITFSDALGWVHEVEPQFAYDARRWRFFGYEGWIFKHLAVGQRDDGIILQLRSDTAKEHFHTIPAGWRCTRLDAQVTVLLEEPLEVAQSHFTLLGGHSEEGKLKLSLITNNRGEGGTLYVGSRKSFQSGRIYDKGAQRGLKLVDEVGNLVLWRYEVEFKKELAEAVYRTMFHVKQQHELYTPRLVYDWFIKRGIWPLFDPEDYNLEVEKAVTKTFNGDAELRKLNWLWTSVRPVVRELKKAGRLSDVLASLDLLERELHR